MIAGIFSTRPWTGSEGPTHPTNKIVNLIKRCFDLKPASIISKLKLKRPIYNKFASYGHFGREKDCTWECLDMVEKIKQNLKG